METFKRFLAGLVIFICALGLILCFAGIIGAWMINTPLTESLTGALDKVEVVLNTSHDRMDRINTNLIEVQDLLTNLKEKVTEAGESLTENSPTLTYLSNKFGADLKPKIETTAEVVSTIRSTIVSVNSSIETANNIPFVSIPSLPMEQLSTLDQQLQEMVTTVKSLGDAIKDIEAGIVDRTTTVIMVPVERLSELIILVQTPVGTFNTNLVEVKTAVVNTNARIPSLIDWGSVLLTLILIWFILAQASLLYGGWYYLKTGTIPTIQISYLPNSKES